MSFYPPNVLPRVELKFKAKSLLRGNWMILIAVTLLYLLLTGFQFTYNYGGTTETGPSLLSGQAYNTMDYFQLYFQYSMSSLGTAVGNIGIENIVLGVVLAIVSALLIDGILTYCYNAWFVTLTEIGDSRRLTFDDFVSHFSNAVTVLLAYLWQQLWLIIWGLLAIPGFLLVVASAFTYTSNSTALLTDVATGTAAFAIVGGSLLYLAGMIAAYIATLRYKFIYQIIADGRGKVGPRQALRYSCAITKGHLKELFVLELSFIPWYFAGAITFGLAFFYLFPYLSTTMALSYRWLRDQAFQDGRLDPAALGYVKAGSAQAASGDTIDI